MTCSRPQRNLRRPGFEPGTPWSEIRRPIHCSTPPPHCSLLVEINLTIRVLYIIAYTYMQLQNKAFYKTFFPSKRGSVICIMVIFDDKNIVYLLSVDPVINLNKLFTLG